MSKNSHPMLVINSRDYQFIQILHLIFFWLQTNHDALKFLKQWRAPHIAQLNFGCKHFKSLLPADLDIKVGKVWDIIPRLTGKNARGQLSNNRYYPPEPDAKEKILFRILQMVHPRPFLLSRFGPHGTSAVVRAKNSKYLDIVFRYFQIISSIKIPINYFKWE